MQSLKVKTTMTNECLGTLSNDPKLHETYQASKSKDKEKIKEELAAMPAEELYEKGLTVFPRNEDGSPFMWDYQVRGHIKSFFKARVEFGGLSIKVGKKEYKFSKWTYKRLVDEHIFVTPRKIKLELPEGSDFSSCTRPLIGDTPQGPRVCLATSETVPEGTTAEFEIHCMQPELAELMKEALDYGAFNGFLQWRNSGKGTFTWEERK